VPLGGSLRASRAAWLARPEGPLAAVDLADGRALEVVLREIEWIELGDGEATLPLPVVVAVEAPQPGAPPLRRRRFGAALALGGALGTAAVALATGLSGTPAPAAAGPTARPGAVGAQTLLRSVPALRARPRGGRAEPVPAREPARRPPPPPAVRASPAVPVVRAPPSPPPLPELPSAPAL
jgi:hypothetical protein